MKRILATALVTFSVAGAAVASTGPELDTGRSGALNPQSYSTTGETKIVNTADYLAPQDRALVDQEKVSITVFETQASTNQPAWYTR